MSSIKKVTSPIFYTVAFIAILMFGYEFLIRHFPDDIARIIPQKKVTTKQVTSASLVEPSAELKLLSEKLQAQEAEITKLNEAIANINRIAANSEKYSKFFLIISNLDSILKSDNTVDVTFEVNALQNFAANDVQLSKILQEVGDITSVEGSQYFKNRFGYVVRKVMKQHYKNTTDNPVVSYIKTHIMPYFAYISPDGNHASHLSYIFYQAHQQLESQNLEGMYKTLLTIKSDNEHFKDFMQKLEQHARLTSAMSASKKHIEAMLVE